VNLLYLRHSTVSKGEKSIFNRVVIFGKISPVTGLDWPWGFQEVKVPRLHDNGTGWW